MWPIAWDRLSQILLTGLTSALFTGILAFLVQSFIKQWLSNRMEEFKKDLQLAAFEYQTWWKLKAETYSQIMASLVDLQYCLKRYMDSCLGQSPLDPQVVEEYHQARKHLAKTAVAGTYIVSDDAAAALQELQRELDETYELYMDEWSRLDIRYCAAIRCFERISEYAKTDLHTIE